MPLAASVIRIAGNLAEISRLKRRPRKAFIVLRGILADRVCLAAFNR